jgi:hypothetical protein
VRAGVRAIERLAIREVAGVAAGDGVAHPEAFRLGADFGHDADRRIAGHEGVLAGCAVMAGQHAELRAGRDEGEEGASGDLAGPAGGGRDLAEADPVDFFEKDGRSFHGADVSGSFVGMLPPFEPQRRKRSSTIRSYSIPSF